jgi:hypothetical protein
VSVPFNKTARKSFPYLQVDLRDDIEWARFQDGFPNLFIRNVKDMISREGEYKPFRPEYAVADIDCCCQSSSSPTSTLPTLSLSNWQC